MKQDESDDKDLKDLFNKAKNDELLEVPTFQETWSKAVTRSQSIKKVKRFWFSVAASVLIASGTCYYIVKHKTETIRPYVKNYSHKVEVIAWESPTKLLLQTTLSTSSTFSNQHALDQEHLAIISLTQWKSPTAFLLNRK